MSISDGQLVVVDHPDHPAQARLVEHMPALEQADQLLEEPPRLLGLIAADHDLVAADLDLRARERRLDLAEMFVTGADERRHEMRARDDDSGRGVGCRHEIAELSALTGGMVARFHRSITG